MAGRAKRKLAAVQTKPEIAPVRGEPDQKISSQVVRLLVGGFQQFVTRKSLQDLLPDRFPQDAHNPHEHRINLPTDIDSLAVHVVLLAALNPGIPLDSNPRSHGLTLDMLHKAAAFLKISWQKVGLSPLLQNKLPASPAQKKTHKVISSFGDIQNDFEKKAIEAEFLEITLADILKVIREGFLAVSSEMDVYQAVMRWCNHRYPSRCTKEIFDLLLPEIRWDLLPGTLHVAVLTAMGPLRETLTSIQHSVFPSAHLVTVPHRERYHTEKVFLFFADRNQVNLKVFDWRTSQVCSVPLPPDITAWSVYKDMGPVVNGALWFRVQQGQQIKTLAYSVTDKKVSMQFEEAFVSGQCYLMAYLNGMIYKWNMKNDESGISGASFKFNPESRTFEHSVSSRVPWPQHHRTEGASDSWNGKLYLCGGTKAIGQAAVSAVEVFDSRAGQWSSLPNMLEARRCFAVRVCSGFLYVTGGATVGSSEILSSCERLNLNSPLPKWERIASLSWPRYQHCMFVANEQVYVCGGYSSNGVQFNWMEVYEPLRNRWNKLLKSDGKGFEPISACATVSSPYKVFCL